MPTWIEELASQLLDRLGRNWKTTAGLGLMFLLSLAISMNWIPQEDGLKYISWASVIFGIGLYHKAIRKDPVDPPPPVS